MAAPVTSKIRKPSSPSRAIKAKLAGSVDSRTALSGACRQREPAVHGRGDRRLVPGSHPKIKPGTVAAHLRGLTANDPSRHHYPGLAAKPPLFFRAASGELVRFDADTHASEAVASGAGRPARRHRRSGLGGPRAYADPRIAASIQALP